MVGMLTIMIAAAMPVRAQERSEPVPADDAAVSTARAPQKITLGSSVVVVSGGRGATGTSVSPAQLSPLVAAASRARSDRAKVQISNSDLKTGGGRISGVTGGTAGVNVPPPPDSSEILKDHEKAMEQWRRDVRKRSQAIASLQEEVTQLRAAAGTHEERVANEDDPARMEALEASRGSLLQTLESRETQLEQERQQLDKTRTSPPRIR